MDVEWIVCARNPEEDSLGNRRSEFKDSGLGRMSRMRWQQMHDMLPFLLRTVAHGQFLDMRAGDREVVAQAGSVQDSNAEGEGQLSGCCDPYSRLLYVLFAMHGLRSSTRPSP